MRQALRKGVMLNRVSDVYHFSAFATANALHAMVSESMPSSTAAALMLRAIDSVFRSDVPGAITLLNRTLNIASPDDAPYVADMLAQYLVATGDFQRLEHLMSKREDMPAQLEPAVSAMLSILNAVRGDITASRVLARTAIESAVDADSPDALGRVLNRCGLAAYYRGDYDEACELSLRAARVLELHGAHWSVAACYSVAAAIAQDWSLNGHLAASYFACMVDQAELAGHSALRRSAVAACYNVAAERFDEATHGAMRQLLMARPEAQQHQEAGLIIFADVLGFGWKGEFAAAEAALTAFAISPTASPQQRALVEAFLALIAAANGDDEVARMRSRGALKRSARAPYEPLHERRARTLARLLSAAACFIIGDIVRGQRALSGRYDPGHHYRELLSSDYIDLARCPELFRGYAQFINVASARARALRPGYRLTRAELDLLAVLPQGSTLAELAIELSKSRHTIARQVESIYQKLGARNRTQAVQKAREFRLIP